MGWGGGSTNYLALPTQVEVELGWDSLLFRSYFVFCILQRLESCLYFVRSARLETTASLVRAIRKQRKRMKNIWLKRCRLP